MTEAAPGVVYSRPLAEPVRRWVIGHGEVIVTGERELWGHVFSLEVTVIESGHRLVVDVRGVFDTKNVVVLRRPQPAQAELFSS